LRFLQDNTEGASTSTGTCSRIVMRVKLHWWRSPRYVLCHLLCSSQIISKVTWLVTVCCLRLPDRHEKVRWLLELKYQHEISTSQKTGCTKQGLEQESARKYALGRPCQHAVSVFTFYNQIMHIFLSCFAMTNYLWAIKSSMKAWQGTAVAVSLPWFRDRYTRYPPFPLQTCLWLILSWGRHPTFLVRQQSWNWTISP